MRISDWSSDVCSSDLLRDLAADLLLVQALEVELQAARQHRDQQLLRIGGGEQESDVLRRLLECLEQRVERLLRQHVHFVDQVDLVRSEEHTSELQSLMRISYAVFCFKPQLLHIRLFSMII